ncbi:MAG: hypothetical protein WBC44_19560, partial [Planctomycetaceae bacterium]
EAEATPGPAEEPEPELEPAAEADDDGEVIDASFEFTADEPEPTTDDELPARPDQHDRIGQLGKACGLTGKETGKGVCERFGVTMPQMITIAQADEMISVFEEVHANAKKRAAKSAAATS